MAKLFLRIGQFKLGAAARHDRAVREQDYPLT
jgi:hypothetical protein